MASDDCALYAELLVNIRQISLAVSLSSPCDASTHVAVLADCRTIELKHRDSTHLLTLPAKTALGGTLLPVQDKQKGSTSLSWRLALDASSLPPSHQLDEMVWSATDLDPKSGVACRQCATDVVCSGSVKAWKDLPSENWAEMMEFWHCHKPDHHHPNPSEETGKAGEESLAARGYGASSAISAQEGVGFVDLTTLLFEEKDCQNVTFSLSGFDQGMTERQGLSLANDTTNYTPNLNVFCSSCRAHLGFFNFRTSAVTLLKWRISCKSASAAAPAIPECLAATLISTISRSGSSKSLITPLNGTAQESHAEGSPGNAIHIWVLNSSIVYSSSGIPQRTPAIKLLYRPLPREEADRMLETVTCDSLEVNLPVQALGEVIRHLDDSNALLPPTERVFKEWKVGLLTRWEQKV
ncbi:ubiquitin-conjugating enzyme E2-binding protein [Chaetomium fimeti]|uniref:Ubiquitin-conjugating enzyme E2-binding protein n=1 Tax=Chaetomium fimeti TaxID=1854472 RepID=A0AAE0LVY1_9PEZI|nr:ubiquitin-conjugating enzyme E2-binding protein [Chaetomium fimeti]